MIQLPAEAERLLAVLEEPRQTQFKALLLAMARAKPPTIPVRTFRHLDAEEVAAALVHCHGRIRAAARLLGCAPSSVSRHRGALLFRQRNTARRDTLTTPDKET